MEDRLRGLLFDDVRDRALAWPGVEVSTSYGTPALKVRGKLLARLRENGDTIVLLGIERDEREMLIEARPTIFHVTAHYLASPTVLARLSAATWADIEPLLRRRWKALASKKHLAAFNAR